MFTRYGEKYTKDLKRRALLTVMMNLQIHPTVSFNFSQNRKRLDNLAPMKNSCPPLTWKLLNIQSSNPGKGWAQWKDQNLNPALSKNFNIKKSQWLLRIRFIKRFLNKQAMLGVCKAFINIDVIKNAW